MFSTAINRVLLALLTLVPTAGSPRGDDSKERAAAEDRVVVLNDGDVEVVDGDDPVIVRVGRGGFLGVRLVEITDELRAHYGAPKDAGVLVAEVESNSPAARAGIEVGDVLTSVDGKGVSSTWDVSRGVRRKKEGDTVEVELVRGRGSRKVTVTLDERKGRAGALDLDLGELGDKMRRHAWVWKDGDLKDGDMRIRVPHFKIENLEELPSLRERLEELEKRVKDLEKKLTK